MARIGITIAYQEKPGGRLGQLDAGAELANGEGGGRLDEVGLGNELGDDSIAEDGLAEEDGGIETARDSGVQFLRLSRVEGERCGAGQPRFPVAKKAIEATAGGDS